MERPGGYTRILRLGHRRGDGAETALVELVGSEFDPKKAAAEKAAQAEAGDAPKSQKSVGERLRAAASRIRGDKKEKKTDATKASKPARGAQKKTHHAAQGRRLVTAHPRRPGTTHSLAAFVAVRRRCVRRRRAPPGVSTSRDTAPTQAACRCLRRQQGSGYLPDRHDAIRVAQRQ